MKHSNGANEEKEVCIAPKAQSTNDVMFYVESNVLEIERDIFRVTRKYKANVTETLNEKKIHIATPSSVAVTFSIQLKSNSNSYTDKTK